LRVGGELLPGFGLDKEFGEVSGGELEADFGELAGFARTEVFEEVFLAETGLDSAILFGAPFFVAAAGFPVGNVALGDEDADFIQGVDDILVGDVILEHAVDHVAFEEGEMGDFAIAGPLSGFED
jgi:hypothetical protein